MINGFIILIDQPFRIGDRIKIESMDTWGDVEAIGSRTTQIRTIDNRLVIVPNSIIGRSQVENFTYPDPSYRVEVSLGIGYGSDIDQVIEIITNAMLRVPGIMESKPPFVDFLEFGDSAMIFRAYYWLETYEDLRLRTQVNKSISDALEEANVEMPFVTYDVNLAYKELPNSENNTNTT
jgi:small-conductance mechanosensitive channel